MKFSKRMGINVRQSFQINSMDDKLRMKIWNWLRLYDVELDEAVAIWDFIYLPMDKFPFGDDDDYDGPPFFDSKEFIESIRNKFFGNSELRIQEQPWWEVYDLVEFVVRHRQQKKLQESNWIRAQELNEILEQELNEILEQEMSGYRLLNGEIVPIIDEQELDSIDVAMKTPTQSVQTHLATALNHLSNRQRPDYRNSIKESISAVESLCKKIVNNDKATLGQALTEIERNHKLPEALKKSFTILYGYTSDEGGIRHALIDDSLPVDFDEAKFMLVACSAFVNYLQSKYN